MRVVAVDQGTTGTKSFTLDFDGNFAAVASLEHRQIYPQKGWVEHDPQQLLAHVREAIHAAGQVDAIGIDNQGETVVAWDAQTGVPLYNAIVWQDDRTADVTTRLKAQGAEALTLQRAGLPLDPYFSASKLRWFLDHVEAANDLLRQGRLRLGTSDAFFLDRLCGTFATDVTTASRTSLMSLDTLQWDEELCRLFGVPLQSLPAIKPSAGAFGEFEGIPVSANLVDQQAALFGHGCTQAGEAKITFGTGAFALASTGARRVDGARFGILPTLSWQIGSTPAQFAIDGGVYNAGSAVNWARRLGLFRDFAEIDRFDPPAAFSRDLVFVPALSGLACPHWDRKATGLWIGMGLDTSARDLVQSLLEGVALRTAEVVGAMRELLPLGESISIDGGMARNDYFTRFLANVLQMQVRVSATGESSALGTARMALLGAGVANLPPLPQPRGVIDPNASYGAAARARFAEALQRAKAWKRD